MLAGITLRVGGSKMCVELRLQIAILMDGSAVFISFRAFKADRFVTDRAQQE
jgi:hypothetical protein